MMAEQCPKCKTPLQDAPGIGPYCPNLSCVVKDNLTGSLTIASEFIDPTNFVLHGPNGPVVTINMVDGTVTVHQKGKDEEAAKIFWDAITRLHPRRNCKCQKS